LGTILVFVCNYGGVKSGPVDIKIDLFA